MRDDLLRNYQSNRHLQHFLEEIIVSSAILGAAFGAAIGGWLSDKIGRRTALLIGDGLFCTGAILMATATTVTALIIGRIIVGLGVGLASVTVPVYIAECSSVSLRASLITVNVLMITSGQLVSYIVNYFFTFVPGTWRWMLGVAGVPALFQFLVLCFLPESPRWLFLKEKRQKALKVLKLLMPPDEINDVEDELKEQLENPCPEQNIFKVACQRPEVRFQLSIGIGLQVIQQLCGINTVMYYTPSILEIAGFVDKQQALLFSIFPALVNALGTLVGMWCIDRYGRRKLLLSSLTAVLGALLLGAYAFHLSDVSTASVIKIPSIPDHASCPAINCHDCLNTGINEVSCSFCASLHNLTTFKGVCVHSKQTEEFCPASENFTVFNSGCPSPYQGWTLTFLMLYLIAFAPGMGPVPWAVNAEIYPGEIRGAAGGAAATANWITNFLVSQSFLTIAEAVGIAGVFVIYASCALFGLIYFSASLPETKGLTFEEIQKLYKSKVVPQQPK
eukprot:g1570.t1